MQRGYIILIVGAALLISGIVVSALWAVPFAGKVLRESTILSKPVKRPLCSKSEKAFAKVSLTSLSEAIASPPLDRITSI